jgi:AcrR family transcriptional regulator
VSPSTRRSPPPATGRPRARPRQTAREPRDEIIAVASRLFARQGIAGTKMSHIAEGAGLQQSSIYYYFSCKEEILREIVATVNRLPLAFLARVDAEGGSAAMRLFRLVRFDVRTLCEFPYDINEIHRISGQDPDTFAEYWAERQALNDGVEKLVREGVESHELIPVDPRLTALTILANDEGVQNWYRPVGDRRLRGRDGTAYAAGEIASFLAHLTLRSLLEDRRRLERLVARADELDSP